MKILLKEFTHNENMYPGFVIGTMTDKDLIARSCGYFSNTTICSCNALLEGKDFNYKISINFSSLGKQKTYSFDEDQCRNIAENLNKIEGSNYTTEEIEELMSQVSKSKVNSEKNVLLLALLLKNRVDIFVDYSWYEGSVSLQKINKETNESSNLISDEYESNLGMEGVYESLQHIQKTYENDDQWISLLDYLLAEFDQ